MTPDSLIDALGGTSEVAQHLCVKSPRVSNWRARKKIPAELWSEIVRLADLKGVKGVTLAALSSMHARRTAGAETVEARP